MARLIDADALLKDSDKRKGAYGLIFSAEDIRNAPTIEAEPVKRGKWGKSDIPDSILSKCSVCGFSCGAYTFRYCPDCGARMDDDSK